MRVFPRHPGADDAAYRLASCYESQGQWAEALRWYAQAAAALPDGDLGFDACGRLLFVLDARLPKAELKRLSDEGDLPESLRILALYTLAVRELREEDYQEAAGYLEEFLTLYGEGSGTQDPGPLFSRLIPAHYPFWAKVKEQLQTPPA